MAEQIIADIQAVGGSAPVVEKTYTVKAGDTLSKIASSSSGDANAYMVIFEANRILSKDPTRSNRDRCSGSAVGA